MLYDTSDERLGQDCQEAYRLLTGTDYGVMVVADVPAWVTLGTLASACPDAA
jgi:hypothetical protein